MRLRPHLRVGDIILVGGPGHATIPDPTLYVVLAVGQCGLDTYDHLCRELFSSKKHVFCSSAGWIVRIVAHLDGFDA
jgi:hypothetical protein